MVRRNGKVPEVKTRRRAAPRRGEETIVLGDGVIARIADRAFENPAMSGGLLVMGLTAAAIVSNANVNSASPAKIAIASPNCLWHVGFPRRRSSLSKAGKSS